MLMIFKKLCQLGHVTDSWWPDEDLDAFDTLGYVRCYALVKDESVLGGMKHCLRKSTLHSSSSVPHRYYSHERQAIGPWPDYPPPVSSVTPYEIKELPPLPRMHR